MFVPDYLYESSWPGPGWRGEGTARWPPCSSRLPRLSGPCSRSCSLLLVRATSARTLLLLLLMFLVFNCSEVTR